MIEGEVAELLHGDDDLDPAVIGLHDRERQFLPGRVGIVALEHAQLAALAGGPDAIDPAQLLDAGGVEGDADRGGDEQRDARLLLAVGVEDGHRVAGEGFALEVQGGRAALAIGLQQHRVGGVAGARGDRERDAGLLDDRLRMPGPRPSGRARR